MEQLQTLQSELKTQQHNQRQESESLRQQLAVHATGHEPVKVIVEYMDQAAPAALLTD